MIRFLTLCFILLLMVLQAAGNTNQSNTGADQHNAHPCVSKKHIYVKEGQSAQMAWNRTSGGERGNRLKVNSQVIASLPRHSLNMSCSAYIKDPSLEELCHKRLEFFSNTTTILVKLRNLSRDEHWNFTLTHALGGLSPCSPQDIKIVRVIVPSHVVLSTVSAVANNTVRTPVSVVSSPISTTLTGSSSSVQNTARPPTTGTANRNGVIIYVPIGVLVISIRIALLSWYHCKRNKGQRGQRDTANIVVQLDSTV